MKTHSNNYNWVPISQLSNVSNLLADPHFSYSDLDNIDLFNTSVADIDKEKRFDAGFTKILTALSSIEANFTRAFQPKCQIYLLGWKTLETLISVLEPSQLSNSDIRKICSALHQMGLIYRLPSAKKFGYSPIAEPQIRISSWGLVALSAARQYVDISDKALNEWIADSIAMAKEDYQNLIALCTSNQRPLNVSSIHSLNDVVSIPIVT